MPAVMFRKRPVVVEAIRWDGENEAEIVAWMGEPLFARLDDEAGPNCGDPDATGQVFDRLHSTWVLVFTGQWVVRGVQGEFYPIAQSVLDETYEPAG